MYLGTGIKTIGSYAFGSSSIETMYITSIEISIAFDAFSGMNLDSTIYYVGTKEQWSEFQVSYSGNIKYDYKA